ncbi:MAG: hypothetical protein M2R45_00916 [Verrucomicrobia subdivision 3 bacterium]|nr:hypothetical protein [Limisphaerales bacterium]MCS1414585.1 hypothetical protein [Limisphaerales bacterium]
MMTSQDWNRRDFLKTASSATLSALAAGYPVAALADSVTEKVPPPNADCLIILWMGGGMSATETFDPKRYVPFEKGMDPNRVLSTFPSIDTAVDHIKFSSGLERIAGVMDQGALIRTYTAGDLGFILHSRHQYQWHTGYAPPQTVAAPHLGAVVARTLGPRDPAVPAFIDIGQRFDVGESEELKAFHTAGFLGSEYGPFIVPYPDQAVDTVRPPKGMGIDRFQNRNRLYKKLLNASPIGRYGSDYQQESLVQSMEYAHRLLSSPAAKAFDLSLEPRRSLAKYLPSGVDPGALSQASFRRDGSYEAQTVTRFGLGCLLARRLVEVGARFIEVTTEYIPFLNWDTHEHGHKRLVDMKKQIDSPVAQLVLDLEERGLLDRTLIVLASEFSRDMMTEGKPGRKVKDQVFVPEKIEDEKHYGMHRHFTDAGCVLMFGGGIKKGFLYGETADERPCKTIKDRVVIEDLHATIYRAMGISPRHAYEIEQRPFYVTRDGLGKPIERLFA